jgi:hypothetical protein
VIVRNRGEHFTSLLLVLLIASTAFMSSGCRHRDWVVFVSSDASADVIVRIAYAAGSRDVLVLARAEEVVLSLPDPRPPATIDLLDPQTCKVLASGDLPAEAAIVAFGDGQKPGQLSMEIAARPETFSGQLPSEDKRCVGK